MYVRLRVSCLRHDYYFNRKECGNDERGHFATENGEVVCSRSAPALNVVLSGGCACVEVSGAVAFVVNQQINLN